jgi:hypothetical protein
MANNCASELHKAERWVKENIDIFLKNEQGVLEIEVGGVFDLGVSALYELLTHPDNSQVFRGVKRCIKRRILWSNGCKHQVVEVVNESDWNIAGILRGVAKTKLLVEQDETQHLVHFVLAAHESNPFKELYGRWRIYPIESEKNTCLLTLYQRFKLRKMPSIIISTVGHFVKSQIRCMFEDLAIEADRLRQGNGSLGPYISQCMKEFGEESKHDPLLALRALQEMSQAHPTFPVSSKAETRNSPLDFRNISRISAAAHSLGKFLVKNSQQPPISHPISEFQYTRNYCPLNAAPKDEILHSKKIQLNSGMNSTAYYLWDWLWTAANYFEWLIESDDEDPVPCETDDDDDFPSLWFVIA